MIFPAVKNILDEGLQFADTPSEKRNIRLTNLLSLVLVGSVIGVIIYRVLSHGFELWPLLALVLNIVLLLYVIILNKSGHIQKSKIFLSWLVSFLLILDLYCLVQQNGPAETSDYVRFRMLQIVTACIPLLIFAVKDKKQMLIAIIVPLIMTIFYDPSAILVTAEQRASPLHKVFSYYTLATVLIFATVALSVYIVKMVIEHREFRDYLTGDFLKRKALELEVEETNLLLTERLKELNTLYTVTQIIRNRKHQTVQSALAAITNALPLGWQHPEKCSAMIQLNESVFATSNHQAASQKQSAPIKVKNRICGKVEVAYQNTEPNKHAFLKEETELINTIAELIGTFLEEKENEESYNQAQANLNATINNTEFLVYSVDVNKKLLTFNKPFEKFMKENMNAHLIIGDRIQLHSGDPNIIKFSQRFDAHYDRVLLGEQLNLDETLFGRNYSFSMCPIMEKERILGASVFGHDITELTAYRLSLEEKVRERTRELNESLAKEKELATMKTRFASMVSHEFRTPLATIRLSANQIRRYKHQLSIESLDDKVNTIIHEVNHMANVLEDVLMIGKPQDNKIQTNKAPVNLSEFFVDLTGRLEKLNVKSGHEIKCTIELTNQFFETDSDLLKNIFVNLLTNAIKFSPKRKSVYMRIFEDQSSICFEVQDEGIGIPADELERIFQPFDRGSNTKDIPGTGLGLAIVKKAVDLLNGTLQVTSVVDHGTLFSVRLPRNSVRND